MAQDATQPVGENAGEPAQPQPEASKSFDMDACAARVGEEIEGGMKPIQDALDKQKKATRSLRAELGKVRNSQKTAGAAKGEPDDDDDAMVFTEPEREYGVDPTEMVKGMTRVTRVLEREGYAPVLRENPALDEALTDIVAERLKRGDTADEALMYARGMLVEPAMNYFSGQAQAKPPAGEKDPGADTAKKQADDAAGAKTTQDTNPVVAAGAGGARPPAGISAASGPGRSKYDAIRSFLPGNGEPITLER